MFWFLHRSVMAVGWCVLGALGFWLYQQRAALQPAWDYVVLWYHAERGGPETWPELAGRVTGVYNGASFQLRHASGWHFNYGLAGVDAPQAITSFRIEEQAAFHASRSNLVTLIQGEEVRIEVTLANPQTRTGLGVVWLNSTNVNLAQLSAGHGRLKREQLRGLPVRQQYEYARGERTARRERRGLWAETAAGAGAARSR
ncbi:MAG: hypothetical protein FJ387_29875 [Verrucomicrobia bacterium]|nr:hypothetical protein [Verrucomicrobiota bacterium]